MYLYKLLAKVMMRGLHNMLSALVICILWDDTKLRARRGSNHRLGDLHGLGEIVTASGVRNVHGQLVPLEKSAACFSIPGRFEGIALVWVAYDCVASVLESFLETIFKEGTTLLVNTVHAINT